MAVANWLTKFRGIHQVWSGELPEDPYIINFHKGLVRDVDLPAAFTMQADYYENNLNLLLAAGDGGFDASHINVGENPQFHIYLCLPDNTHQRRFDGRDGRDTNILTANMERLHELNAR